MKVPRLLQFADLSEVARTDIERFRVSNFTDK